MIFAAVGKPKNLQALLVNQFPEVTIQETAEVFHTTTPDQLILMASMADDAVFAAHIEGGKRNGSGVVIDITGDQGDLRISNRSAFGDVGDDYVIVGARGDNLPLEKMPVPDLYDWLPPSNLPSAVLELGNLYVAIARDLESGTREASNFDDAVWMHRLIESFEQSSRSGLRLQV